MRKQKPQSQQQTEDVVFLNSLVVCSLPLTGVPQSLFRDLAESFIVAVDGGILHLKKSKLVPAVWVGDSDSLKKKSDKPKGVQLVDLPRSKNYSDLEAALHVAGQAFVSGAWNGDLILVGAQGGRLDHELVNFIVVRRWLQTLSEALGKKNCPAVASYGVHGLWIASMDEVEFVQPKNKIFSVFTLENDLKVSISGAKFSLKNKVLHTGSLGLSNQGLGKVVRVQSSEKNPSGPYFVVLPSD